MFLPDDVNEISTGPRVLHVIVRLGVLVDVKVRELGETNTLEEEEETCKVTLPDVTG